jgi:hypothetical protein
VVTDNRLYASDRSVSTGLTYPRSTVTLGDMVLKLQRLDPDRRRRRLQLLAELADAKALRDRVHPRRIRADQLRELIATRRRLAN